MDIILVHNFPPAHYTRDTCMHSPPYLVRSYETWPTGVSASPEMSGMVRVASCFSRMGIPTSQAGTETDKQTCKDYNLPSNIYRQTNYNLPSNIYI